MLKVDWNPINNLIISGGEDCKYKVLNIQALIYIQQGKRQIWPLLKMLNNYEIRQGIIFFVIIGFLLGLGQLRQSVVFQHVA